MTTSTAGAPPKVDVAEAVRLHHAGVPLAEIGRRFGVSHSAIAWRLKTAGARQPVARTDPRPGQVTAVRPATSWPAPTDGWEAASACRGVDDDGRDRFHPATTDDTSTGSSWRAYETARAFCRACPVTRDCLLTAMRAEGEQRTTRHGVWGGLSPRQRGDLTPGDDLPAVIRAALADAVRPLGQASDRTDFTVDEMRAANRIVDRWRRKGGPAPDPDLVAGYRAYQRWRAQEKRARERTQAAS